MRIQIEVPEEFEEDYRKDRFRDFFERVRTDIDCRGLCGNYERETAGMFIDAGCEIQRSPPPMTQL